MSISTLIQDYHAQIEAFAAMHHDAMTYDDEVALEAKTYGPARDALDNPPAATSREDAIAALEYVLADDCFSVPTDEALVQRVLDYLKR